MNSKRRGGIYFANLGERIGRKRVLVVSYEGINRGLRQPVCALITSRDRERSLATYVVIEPTDTNTGKGVRETSYVLCHYLLTLSEEAIDDEPEGVLSAFKMIEVRDSLRVALDLG